MVHLTQKQFEDYCQNQLTVPELLSVTDHLDGCEECRRQTEGALNSDAAFLDLRFEVFSEDAEISHLTTDQIGRYVDKRLFGEEIQSTEDHLSHCEQCIFAVDDLRAFRNEISTSLEHEYSPAPVIATSESWFSSFSKLFRGSPAPAFGAALAILLLAVTGWVVLRAVRERVSEQEMVVSTTPPSEPVSPVEPAPLLSQPEPVTVVAQLNDGEGLLTLDQGGKLSGADNLPPGYQSLIKKALTSGRVEKSPDLKGLTRPSSSLMSSDKQSNEFTVIDPIGVVLMTNQPTFRWTPLEAATGYVVEVYDETFKLVVSSPQLKEASWAAPQPLPRGMIYAWQVKAIKDGQEIAAPRPPAPQARFRILGQAKANELAKARRAYSSSHLVLGLLYTEAGLLKEAEQEFRALVKENPDSDLARSLLRQVRVLRR